MAVAFKKYIEAEIQTAESSMTTTYNRELRLKAITTYQKYLKDKTYEEIIKE